MLEVESLKEENRLSDTQNSYVPCQGPLALYRFIKAGYYLYGEHRTDHTNPPEHQNRLAYARKAALNYFYESLHAEDKEEYCEKCAYEISEVWSDFNGRWIQMMGLDRLNYFQAFLKKHWKRNIRKIEEHFNEMEK
jgi:hypothetical protein